MLELRGPLAPQQGALLLRALESAGDALRERARAAEGGSAEPGSLPQSGEFGGSAEPPHPTRTEALAAVAEDHLSGGPAAAAAAERYQVVVHVDAETLTTERDLPSEAPDRRSELEDGPAIAAETARRLGCDAALVPMAESGGKPLSVGRRARAVRPAMRRALSERDRGCRFPGCERRRFVDAHHITHWAHGGETSLSNLVLLCRYHHRLVHEGGYAIERRGEALVFRTPLGFELEPVPRLDPGPDPPLPAARAGRPLSGTGEKMDLEHACFVMFPVFARERGP
jgi:hypothetical protein